MSPSGDVQHVGLASDVVRVVLHPEQEAGVAEALRSLPGVELIDARSDDEVVAALTDGARCLVTHVWDDRLLNTDLAWIQCQGAGVDQFPKDLLEANHIVLTNARGAHPVAAEHAFALLLAVAHDLRGSADDQRQRQWRPRDHVELSDLTMTIVGLGSIGENVARRAQGWNMTILGVTRSPEKYAGCLTDVRGLDQLQTACAISDVLMLTAPAPSSGQPMIGEPELAALGDGWLVNVGRGSLVDEASLIEWLSRGVDRDHRMWTRGAGLDVFQIEPVPQGSPLWTLPNVVMTPHSAGSSRRYGERLAPIVEANVAAFRGQNDWTNRIV